MSQRFTPRRVKWQRQTIQDEMDSYTEEIMQLYSKVPNFFKPLPRLFFTFARYFVATHYESVIDNNGEGEDSGMNLAQDVSPEETEFLLNKVMISFIPYGTVFRKSQSRLIEHKSFLDDSFPVTLRCPETLLADMTMMVGPVMAYNDSYDFGLSRYAGCQDTLAIPVCRYSNSTCFMLHLQCSPEEERKIGGVGEDLDAYTTFGNTCYKVLGFAAYVKRSS